LNRNEGETDTKHESNGGDGIAKEERKGRIVYENGDDDESGNIGKLLDGHVADETEAVVGDVLW